MCRLFLDGDNILVKGFFLGWFQTLNKNQMSILEVEPKWKNLISIKLIYNYKLTVTNKDLKKKEYSLASHYSMNEILKKI